MSGINHIDFKEEIIRPALHAIGLWSVSAENLLLGTACVESNLGEKLKQSGDGPGLGVFQIEPKTHQDVWVNFLSYRAKLVSMVESFVGKFTEEHPPHELLGYNLRYATAIARIIYLRNAEQMPKHDDVLALAKYWKKHYNTPLGRGRVESFVQKYPY